MVTCCRTCIAQSRVDTVYPLPTQRRKNGRYSWSAGEMQCGKPRVLRRWVDIHLNLKIGADWQLRGQQKRVVTPGQNENYYLAGALHSGTGKVSNIGGNSKSLSLFIRILKHLKATCRRAKTITLIVDNYIIHKSRETLRWLKANPKFRVIYQPVYSPWVNHVEGLWQALHETITRNYQCRSMWQLLKKVRSFMDTLSPFPGGKHGLAKV